MEHLPSPKDLLCVECSDPMAFLMEIYCPLDHPAEAFHRALFVFCCKKRPCVEKGAVKCFRNQLSKENKYYPIDPVQSTELSSQCEKSLPHLCEVCGCLALSACSVCKKAHYCSRAHQKLHWKVHKHTCKDPSHPSSGTTGFCFKEYEILVEAEELDDSDLNLDKVCCPHTLLHHMMTVIVFR